MSSRTGTDPSSSDYDGWGYNLRWSTGYDGQRKADLGDGTYLNPVIAGQLTDPDIVKDGSDYYLTMSTFDELPGLLVWHSRDLVNWRKVGSALTERIGNVLAPSIVKVGDRFYIYAAVLGATGLGTYVVYTDDINGAWSAPVKIEGGNALDPGHGVGEDGKRYLFFGGGRRMQLTDDGLKSAGPMETVYAGWQYPRTAYPPVWIDEGFALEGPKIHRRGDYFYMIVGQGGTYGPPTSHMVVVARSKSINGPWENDPNSPLIRTSRRNDPWWWRGHGTVVEGPDQKPWIMYHAYENGYRTLGRQAILEPLEWTEDGWLRATVKDLTKPIAMPQGGSNVNPDGQPMSDDFSKNNIGTQWRFADAASGESNRASFADKALTLQAKGTSYATSSPLTIVPGDRAYEATIQVSLAGATEAGIMLFVDQALFAGIGYNGQRVTTYAKGSGPGNGLAVSTGTIWLKVMNLHHDLVMYSSTDGQNWTKTNSNLEISGYHHNVARDRPPTEGLRLGLYAYGSGNAVFRDFQYRVIENSSLPPAPPALKVDVSADARSIGGKVHLTVAAKNNDSVPVDVVLTSAFGEKTFKAVAPGKTASVTFNSRAARIDGGEATAVVTNMSDGSTRTITKTASYGAFPTA